MVTLNKSLALLLLLGAFQLHGCASTLLVGEAKPRVASDAVRVYFIDRPRCNFETIAHIQVTGGYLSLPAMLTKMRNEAAGVGASGLHVLQIQQSEIREFGGMAKAIRCLPAEDLQSTAIIADP